MVPKPVAPTASQQSEGDKSTQSCIEKKEQKELLIRQADTVVDPRTMMVHPENTPPTALAVMCAGWLPPIFAKTALLRVTEIWRGLTIANRAWVRGGGSQV